MRIDYPRKGREGFTRWIPSWKLVLGTGLTCGVLGFLALLLAVFLIPIPNVNEVAQAQTTIVYWADDSEMVRLGDTNRISVPMSEIPDHAQKAVLAAEDRDFYEHSGFSIKAITRAFVNNVSGGSRQGGSTITQQYAKNAYLTDEQTITRKIKELILSIKLETSSSKDQILNDYMNTIYLGRGAYGIETAAEAYYDKSAKDLTLEESADIAARIQAPSAYDKPENASRLAGRYQYVLTGMREKGWIGSSEYNRAASAQPQPIERKPVQKYAGPRGYLIEAVRQQVVSLGFTEQELEIGGLRVKSTFDKKDQDAIVDAVRNAGPQSNTKGVRIGLVSMRPESGEVNAMYGGEDYLESQFNVVTQGVPQAGSTFKPFGLAAALEDDISLYSTWNGNSPRTIEGYTVPNQRNKSWGTVTLLQATENSINTPYVDLASQIGPDNVEKAAVKAGVPEKTAGLSPANLTTVLGSSSPHPMDMAVAYSTFANRGERVSPTFIKEIRGSNNGILWEHEVRKERVFDQDVMDVLNYALQRVVTNGSGFKAQSLGRPTAGKTGTTDDNVSSWYIGYAPNMVAVSMMLGENEQGGLRTLNGTGGVGDVTGATFPSDMFVAYMRGALADEDVKQFAQADPSKIGGNPAGSSESASPSESATASESASASPSQSSQQPSQQPTQQPTQSQTPTVAPSQSQAPSLTPTEQPTEQPTQQPTSGGSPAATDVAGNPTAPADPGATAARDDAPDPGESVSVTESQLGSPAA